MITIESEIVPVTAVRKGDTILRATTDGGHITSRVVGITRDGGHIVLDTTRGQHRYTRAAKVRVAR